MKIYVEINVCKEYLWRDPIKREMNIEVPDDTHIDGALFGGLLGNLVRQAVSEYDQARWEAEQAAAQEAEPERVEE